MWYTVQQGIFLGKMMILFQIILITSRTAWLNCADIFFLQYQHIIMCIIFEWITELMSTD